MNLCRWYDQIQHQLAEIENVAQRPSLLSHQQMIEFVVDLPLKYAPLQKETKKKEKKKENATPGVTEQASHSAPVAMAQAPSSTPAADVAASSTPVAAAPATSLSKETKKAKEPHQAQKQQQQPTNDISALDIRVGKIIEVKRHENADSLYVEQIDVGEQKPRTVCSGLVNFIPIERMQDRQVLVCCNLKETNMRGVVSEAMVLAASNGDHTIVDLIEVPEGAQIGEQVRFAGFEGPKGSNITRKHLEKILPDLKTTGEGVCMYKETIFMTSAGPCTSTLLNAQIS